MVDYAGTVAGVVARLDRIPAEAGPGFGWLLAARRKRLRPGIKRHLNLPAPVVVVNNINPVVGIGKISNGAAKVEVYAEPDGAIVQEAHLPAETLGRTLPGPNDSHIRNGCQSE